MINPDEHKNRDKNRLDISIDCVVFGFHNNLLKVLLINYDRPADLYDNRKALPGDLIYVNEDLIDGAKRVLSELTGVNELFLKQFGAFGHPQRTLAPADQAWLQRLRQRPDNRVITIGYYALVQLEELQPVAHSFAKSTEWMDVQSLPALVMDHNLIVTAALDTLRSDLEQNQTGLELLPEKFTLSQLQSLYETLTGKKLDKRNFRKSIRRIPGIVALDEKQKGVLHKPAQLFSYIKEKTIDF